MILTLLLFVSVSLSLSTAKVYSRCDFAQELVKAGVKKNLEHWICLAENESETGIDTRRIVRTSNPGHNFELGVFKISTYFWCEDFRNVINYCGIHCRQLLDDEIADDVRCAMTIISQKEHQGFEAFGVWSRKCKGDKNIKKYIEGCDI